jgi:hypothetical protein
LKYLVLALVIAMSVTSAAKAAQDDLAVGKKVSEKMVLPLSAADQDGRTQSLQSLAGPDGHVLLFSRSLDWRPYGKSQAVV